MEQYYYEYEQDSIYCYPDSFILKNKLNIREQSVLEDAERNITALRILEFWKMKITYNYMMLKRQQTDWHIIYQK